MKDHGYAALTTREDLRLQISRVATLFTEPAFGKPFVGLIAESQHDPALADALHQWLITARRAGAAEVLRRGVERGELRADLDVDVAIDALYGAIYYRLLISHQPLSAQYARTVVDEVFAGLQAPGAREGPTEPTPPHSPSSANPPVPELNSSAVSAWANSPGVEFGGLSAPTCDPHSN